MVQCWLRGRNVYIACECLLFVFWACSIALNLTLNADSCRRRHPLCKLNHKSAPFRQVNIMLRCNSSLQRDKAYWARSHANGCEWPLGWRWLASSELGAWPRVSSRVSIQLSREMVMSQVFGGLPILLMTRHKLICLRTWDLRCHDHSLVSASEEIYHLDQNWTLNSILLC